MGIHRPPSYLPAYGLFSTKSETSLAQMFHLSPFTFHPRGHCVLSFRPGFAQLLMSLDPSSPADKPSLRTEAQTQTSVGLSRFSVERLKKLREEMLVRACILLIFWLPAVLHCTSWRASCLPKC